MYSYRSPLIGGEGIPEQRLKRHKLAWEHKKNGRYREALAVWQELLDTEGHEMSLCEYAATLQQMGVSYRGLWQLRRADGYFRSARKYAERTDNPDLLRAIVLDHTAVLLDRFRPRRAVEAIEAILKPLDQAHPQYDQVLSYLGRSYGRRFGKGNRWKADAHLSEALRYLDNDEQRLDALIWALEVPLLGRNRRADRDAALRIVERDDSLASRAKDIRITYLGFWPLRHTARWVVAMKQRLIG